MFLQIQFPEYNVATFIGEAELQVSPSWPTNLNGQPVFPLITTVSIALVTFVVVEMSWIARSYGFLATSISQEVFAIDQNVVNLPCTSS